MRRRPTSTRWLAQIRGADHCEAPRQRAADRDQVVAGRVAGGFCWRRDGSRWILVGGGGNPFMFLLGKRVDEYSTPSVFQSRK